MGFKLTKMKESYCCPQPWQRLIVMVDGDVYPCCMAFDKQEDLYLGNVKDSSLQEMWDSNRLNYIRNCHEDGDYHAIKSCSTCPYPKEKI